MTTHVQVVPNVLKTSGAEIETTYRIDLSAVRLDGGTSLRALATCVVELKNQFRRDPPPGPQVGMLDSDPQPTNMGRSRSISRAVASAPGATTWR
jgi:hypothetical protein